MNPEEKHTAQILGENGYQTYLVGFNHVDPDPKRLGYQFVPEIKEPGEAGIATVAVDLINNLGSENSIFI